jgi:hypothetical protein
LVPSDLVLLVVPEYPVLLEILVAQHYQNLLLVPLGPVVLVFLFLLVVPDYIKKKKKKKKKIFNNIFLHVINFVTIICQLRFEE